MRAWELVTDVPEVQIYIAYICLVLNILIPGTGTMAASCLGKDDDNGGNKTQLLIGFFQFLTAIYLIGWICSIYWGYLIVVRSKGSHPEITALISKASSKSE